MNPLHPVVLLDLDGTVVDTMALIRESHRHAVRTVLGEEWPDERLVRNATRPLMEQMEAISPPHAEELYVVYRTWNHANTATLIAAFDGIDVLLRDLRRSGVRLGLVTSKSRDAVDLAFACVAIGNLFDVVVSADDTERHKPDPEPLLWALAGLEASPADACYVGDAPSDVRAARAAGMAAIAVTWGFATEAALVAEGPDALARSVDELRDVLAGPA